MKQARQSESGVPDDKSGSAIPSTAAQLLGLSEASMQGSFTANRSVVSLIYDAMTVAWNNGAPPPDEMPGTDFALVANEAARGHPIRFDLNGFCSPPGAGRVRVEIGGQATEGVAAEEQFYLAVAGVLNADAESTRVLVTLDLPEPADGAAAMLTLDSIDVELLEQAAEQDAEEECAA